VVLKPVISEKSYSQVEKGKYVFEVDRRATKIDIRRAVEEIFKVNVIDVNTIVVKGKLKRMGRSSGYRPDRKKAIVTLKSGDKIEFFEGAT
jgi:large subunit ribosomal protein L23